MCNSDECMQADLQLVGTKANWAVSGFTRGSIGPPLSNSEPDARSKGPYCNESGVQKMHVTRSQRCQLVKYMPI